MEKISHYLKSPEDQKGQDGVSEGSDEAHSDSGDSIFITQIPVPEAVRAKRQRAQDFQSDFTSCGGPAFYENETSPSNSNKESTSGKEKKKKTCKLPMYRFSFLNKTEGQGSMALPPMRNQRLHNYAMGGFFNCVQELCESYRKGENQIPSLPTVDMNWECISPISEEEEDRLEDGDFKIVGKKQFVVSLKPKISRPSYNPRKNEVRQQTSTPSTAGCASKEKQRSTIRKVQRITLSPDTESSDDGEVLAQTETPQKCLKIGQKNINFNEKENADEVGSNSDATLCESSVEQYMEKVTEAAATEPHADISRMGNAECEAESQNLPQGDANNGALCSETRVKKKGKKDSERVLEGSPEEAEGQRAAPSVKEAVAEVDEAPRLSQAAADLESKWKEKRVEVDTAVSLNVETGGRKRKKAKNVNDHVDKETGMADEPQYDGNMPKEIKKKKTFNKIADLPQPTTGHVEHCLENPETALETLESSSVKGKKSKKKKKHSTFKDNTEVGEDVCIDVDCFSDVIIGTGSTDLLVKKKSISERVHVSYTPGEDKAVDNTLKKAEALEEQDADLVTEKKKKKKKKKKMKELSDIIVSEATASQSDCLASAQKTYKRKTSSFLVADEEEKAGQTRGDKHACHGGGAEKPDVSISPLTTTSTDTAASLEEGGLKQKKRSAVWDSGGRETDFEEPKKTSPEALPEAGIAEKKKHKRSKSKVMSPVGGWESAAGVGHFETDDAVVFRKNEKKKQKFKGPAEDTESEKSTLNACSLLSPKKKGKHGRSSETLIDIILSKDQATTETLFEHTLPSSSTLGLGDARVKKKKENRDDGDEHLVPLKSFTEITDTEVYEAKKDQRKKQAADCSFISAVPDTCVTQLETSSSHTIRKNKVKKAKRTLHDPSREFLTD